MQEPHRATLLLAPRLSLPSHAPTTSPRVMLKEPDSVFWYMEELNSVFKAFKALGS